MLRLNESAVGVVLLNKILVIKIIHCSVYNTIQYNIYFAIYNIYIYFYRVDPNVDTCYS